MGRNINSSTDFTSTANWGNVHQANPTDPLPAIIDQGFPKGVAFAQWLKNVNASTTLGQITIHDPRHDLDTLVSPSQRWIYSLTTATPVGWGPAPRP